MIYKLKEGVRVHFLYEHGGQVFSSCMESSDAFNNLINGNSVTLIGDLTYSKGTKVINEEDAIETEYDTPAIGTFWSSNDGNYITELGCITAAGYHMFAKNGNYSGCYASLDNLYQYTRQVKNWAGGPL